MALRNAWWMQTPQQPARGRLHHAQPHENWPWNQPVDGIGFSILEETLRKRAGSACKIDVYCYEHGKQAKWDFCEEVATSKELLQMIQRMSANSVTYIIRDMESEATQVLGHSLHISPRFFNTSYVRLRTDNPVERHLSYSLQFMDRYDVDTKPAEAQRLDTSPQYRFRATGSRYHNHTWHVTCIRLIFSKRDGNTAFDNVIQIDSADDAVANALKTLMLRDEERPLNEAEEHAGLGRLLSNTIYLVTYTWTAFFMEGGAHLQILSDKCLDEHLTPIEQLQYTRELHRLAPLWVQVRRRLSAAKDLSEQLLDHPFFKNINNFDNRSAVRALMTREVRVLDDQISRCNEMAEQTNVLISLIFNIATLQDTKAAVEESKAANALASSIRRVTMLTFIYLPLTLASSIFGMNITQITGAQSDSPLWAYFILAVTLMCATFGGWFIWSRQLSRTERRASKIAGASQVV
ncbi:hypothetical protein CC86DRAFT_413415 [Ophiobolus disseminans]|uniref:Cora-domain-containing protein n=1 Tax=Ophiobolus disseminans TaxID=1469910 RepID=A0A6A6ZE84_9PLEO|nr:hypothetical protein CC86DRAFT_413415 [Ophiobolus disseminans]